MRVRELAEWLGATFEGDGEKELAGVAPLETAGARDLAFLDSRKAAKQAAASAAGCLIVPFGFPNPGGRTVIHTSEPRAAFVRAVSRLHPPPPVEPGIHPSAQIAETAEIGPDAVVGPNVSIGSHAKIGARCRIGAGCAIGNRVTLGEDSLLYAHVALYDDVDIGARVILHSGCVIGADGFGFFMAGDHYEKFPQIGRVAIGDDVEIGANSCVDRAALGVTWIGQGTKLDNQVQVAHNCRIGKHVVIAAQTGISGGVVVEDYVIIGGKVGIGDKARIETHAVLGSGCGVLTSKIVRSGQVVWGTPARPIKEYLETLAGMSRMPGLRNEVAELRRRLAELESRGPTAQSSR
jgi:UDP-3-O-[3-hydroxymyristoyl] glucosamine N-acyltransferase